MAFPSADTGPTHYDSRGFFAFIRTSSRCHTPGILLPFSRYDNTRGKILDI